MCVTNSMNSLGFFLKYARFRYIGHRLLMRLKLGKRNRDEYFKKTGLSTVDFLPERLYSMDGIKAIPRKGTYDFYMFSLQREADVADHLAMYENETFVDVGANVGSYSLRIAEHYRQRGVKVIAIEAQPDNYKALCRNIKCNNFKNIRTINKAVTAHRGSVRIYERFHSGIRTGSDLYSIYDTFLGPANITRSDGKIIEVECDTLDNILLAKNGKDKVDVMKIDIEGAEVLALQGATNTLQQLRKIIVEVHGNTLGTVKNILQSYNFEIQITNKEMNHIIGTK